MNRKRNICEVKVAQSCPTLCYPMTYTVHGFLQARILEWVAFPFSRGSSQPRIEPRSPTLLADSLPAEPQGKPLLRKGVWKEIYHNIQILGTWKTLLFF